MRILRLEVFEKDNKLVYIREKSVFAQSEKGIRATHTRLVKWAQREFPEWRDIDIQQIER